MATKGQIFDMTPSVWCLLSYSQVRYWVKKFRMNFKTMLYMSVLMNNYRAEIIAKKPQLIDARHSYSF